MDPKLWTRSTGYRRVYFKHNKGIFYKWYLCAYCRKKFLEKDIVEVDHCIAVNAVKNRWYFQLLFLALDTTVNGEINLVASCRDCNRTKGAKVEGWVMRGVVGKLIFILLQSVSQRLMDTLVSYWYVYVGVLGGLLVYVAYMLAF